MESDGRITIRVRINGTAENPWHKMNLKMNPFPQIARGEWLGAMLALNSLDGDPVEGERDIRRRLEGFSEEFIALCVRNYQPGKRVEFRVSFPA